MQFDIRSIFEIEGESLAFEQCLRLEDVELGGAHPFRQPVEVAGRIENRAGVVTVRYTASYLLEARCDRCQADVTEAHRDDFAHTLMLETHTDSYGDDVIVLPDAVLDLDELVRADILLSVPAKILCREDCKGLCPDCGQNLNEGDCGCQHTTIDPRFTKLLELMSQDESD